MLTEFSLMFVLQNVLFAIAFVLVVGAIKEPIRQKAMAIMLAMAGGMFAYPPYAELGFLWGVGIAVCGYFGLRSYKFIGIGWILHGVWDTFRYSQDAGLVGMGPHSSLGCAVFDPMIALWFFLGAPSVWKFAQQSEAEEAKAQ